LYYKCGIFENYEYLELLGSEEEESEEKQQTVICLLAADDMVKFKVLAWLTH
jgi:hypothetical protein